MKLAVCTNCHKLHKATNITTYKEEGKVAIMNCLHQEFPNNPTPIYRKQCNNPLSVLKRNKGEMIVVPDRKSTRLNSSHSQISYAVFCLKKKKKKNKKL